MPRITDVTFPMSQKLAKTSYSEPCFYPECHASRSLKVDQPICDSHLASIYRSVSDLFKDLDRHSDDVVSDSQLRRRNPYAEVGVVYFMRFGDRVKIGFTTNLRDRLRAVPNDELLGSMPGSRHTERKTHSHFAHLRIKGEWFSMGDDLLEFIAGLDKKPISSK